jgi:hypothetical protein
MLSRHLAVNNRSWQTPVQSREDWYFSVGVEYFLHAVIDRQLRLKQKSAAATGCAPVTATH